MADQHATEESTQNSAGEWVPAIPVPLYSWRKHCKCGRKFWFISNYRGHYALVHILGLGPGVWVK